MINWENKDMKMSGVAILFTISGLGIVVNANVHMALIGGALILIVAGYLWMREGT